MLLVLVVSKFYINRLKELIFFCSQLLTVNIMFIRFHLFVNNQCSFPLIYSMPLYDHTTIYLFTLKFGDTVYNSVSILFRVAYILFRKPFELIIINENLFRIAYTQKWSRVVDQFQQIMVSKLVVQITPPLAFMRFSVNASLYHPLVSSVFIILAILFYSAIFLFLHFLDDR